MSRTSKVPSESAPQVARLAQIHTGHRKLVLGAGESSSTSSQVVKDAPRATMPPPSNIGHYELSEVLGTGSFGTVRLGQHRETGKRVAVKILDKDGSADEHSLRRISAEISTMERISRGCPFIVQLYEVLLSSSSIFLVMEVACCGELFPRLHAGEVPGCTGVQREERVRGYFQQLVLGVQWCHMQGARPHRGPALPRSAHHSAPF